MTQDITRDAAHLLFLVDANPVVLSMPVHVLTQGHNLLFAVEVSRIPCLTVFHIICAIPV